MATSPDFLVGSELVEGNPVTVEETKIDCKLVEHDSSVDMVDKLNTFGKESLVSADLKEKEKDESAVAENENMSEKKSSIEDGLTYNGEAASLSVAEDKPSQKLAVKTNKKNLRVTFPEGGGVVSGYMDPPIPWDDVSSCSTERLVASYLKSCEKFGVRPLPRLLNQIQAIANFHERNETLTLRNDHLDHRHCETLEEVLRKVQFRTIDLEATRLDDEAAVVIFDMIEYYESCIKLNISFNRSFGARGWQACARLVRKASCLQQLDVQGCNISDQLMPFMARALKIGTSLVSLHLENTLMSGKSLITLVIALKSNDTLKELHLGENKLMPSDAIQLSSLIKHNRTLKLLDLRNNHLQDVGLTHLCDGLIEQSNSAQQGLETLVMWNNQLTYQSMNSLCRAVMSSRFLVDLNLGRNNITNEGIHRLKDGLVRNKSLLRIRLQAVKISCEGAVAIAEFVAETSKLLRLDLRDNDIKTGGLMALSLALKVNNSVSRIDLDKEPKKESGVKDFANQQKKLLADILTYVDRNEKLTAKREAEERMKVKIKEEKALQTDDATNESPTHQGLTEACTASQIMNIELISPDTAEETSLVGSEPVRKESPEDSITSSSSLLTKLSSAEHSNLSDRHKLHLDLNLSNEPASKEDFATSGCNQHYSSPISMKMPIVVPPSPMFLSNGTGSLVPIRGDSFLSPDSNSVTSTEDSVEISDSQASDVSFESSPSDENKLKKKHQGGKMQREKRLKFVVTSAKIPLHHSMGIKKSSGKNSRMVRQPSSDPMADAISVIDRTADMMTGSSSPSDKMNIPVLTNPIPVSTNPIPVFTNPISVSTNPISVSTNPISVSTNPIPVSTNPISVSTNPIPVSTNPIPVSTNPIPVSNNPISVSNNPISVSINAIPVSINASQQAFNDPTILPKLDVNNTSPLFHLNKENAPLTTSDTHGMSNVISPSLDLHYIEPHIPDPVISSVKQDIRVSDDGAISSDHLEVSFDDSYVVVDNLKDAERDEIFKEVIKPNKLNDIESFLEADKFSNLSANGLLKS